MIEYPWYEEVSDGSLDQGDILRDCPAGYLPTDWTPEEKTQDFIVDVFDLIVLTQSCDLANDKTEYIVCCPIYSEEHIDSMYPDRGEKYINGQKEKFRQGLIPGSALINAYEGSINQPISIVVFQQIFSLPKVFLSNVAQKKHLRLLPPYREHVSQSFARFFMRVGLPKDIPSFKKKG